MATDKFGVPARDLSDEDLERELRHLHETREDTFFNGTAAALRTHTDRMLELEHEYAARFPHETAPAKSRARRTARSSSAG